MNCKICYEKIDNEDNTTVSLMPCDHMLCTQCSLELKNEQIVYCPACSNTVIDILNQQKQVKIVNQLFL